MNSLSYIQEEDISYTPDTHEDGESRWQDGGGNGTQGTGPTKFHSHSGRSINPISDIEMIPSLTESRNILPQPPQDDYIEIISSTESRNIIPQPSQDDDYNTRDITSPISLTRSQPSRPYDTNINQSHHRRLST